MIKKIVISIFTVFASLTAAHADIHYKNVSQDKTAQELFDKGMLNYYGYLYVQAEYDFRQALIYDPECGMCYWGLAIAGKQQALELGRPFAAAGFADIQKAASLVPPANEFLYDVVQAAKKSFSLNPKISSRELQLAYLDALRNLYRKYQNDADWRQESLALFVDAIAYYPSVNDTGETAAANHCGRELNEDYKNEALALLGPVLKNAAYPDHPGLIHTYIHMAERNLTDPLLEIAARKLPQFSRGEIAHYTHMPNHVYWRRGMYDKAIQANYDAIAIDKNYFKHNGAGLNSYYYEYHYLHSYHFLAALGMLTSNFKLAIVNARAVKHMMNVNHLDGLPDYRDTFFSLEHLVLARFGKWNEVLQLEIPEQTRESGLLFINFSRGLAYLNLGQDDKYQVIYKQIRAQKYNRASLREYQTLVLSYLKACEANSRKAALTEIEDIFLKNNVKTIENILFAMNPPLWFFPYKLFLAKAASERGDAGLARNYYKDFSAMYPDSTL
jgi:hypothetical protein